MPRSRIALSLTLAVAALAALPGPASAYLTAVSVTTEDPSRIAAYGMANNAATPAQLYAIEFPPGATDTRLIGLSFRPQSEDLYALGSSGTLYALQGPPYKAVQINPTPGVNPLQGASSFGVGFNPVKDALAAVDDVGPSLLLSSFNGSVLDSDQPLAYAPGVNFGVAPVPTAAAFGDPAPNAQRTTMYVIDSATDSLAIQGPAESADAGEGGVLHTVGKLELDVTSVGGFGFAPGGVGGSPFALLNPASGGPGRLCRINLHDIYATRGYPVETAGRASCDFEHSLGGAGELEGLAVVPPSSVGFADRTFIRREGSSFPTVDLVRSGSLRRPATVSYGVAPAQTAPQFQGMTGSVNFAPGQARAVLDFPIPDDTTFQPDRNVELLISAVSADTVITPEAEIADVRVVDDEKNPGLERATIEHPKVSLNRVLRRSRLVVHYTCRSACKPFMRLRVAGTQVGTFEGERAGGSRAAVIELDAEALNVIREQMEHGSTSFQLTARFRIEFNEVLAKTLRFRLRR